MSQPLFEGVITALVTPFRNGALDEAAFAALIERQIEGGVGGLVPVGTTGETATLSHDEHKRVVELCIQVVAGRAPVIAGCGSNCTAEAIELTRHAKTVGADAALIVAPYYNRPSQAGLYAHFAAINDAVQLPVLIYNVPSRTCSDISNETMARLAALPNMVGVKDATGDMVRASQMRLQCGEDFVMLSGDDPSALGYIAHGGHGCISVTSNVAPRLCAEFQGACLRGDYGAALKLQDKLMPLHQNLFIETNPAPAKYALSVLGKCSDSVRLPMVALSDKSKTAVRDAMVHAGLIN